MNLNDFRMCLMSLNRMSIQIAPLNAYNTSINGLGLGRVSLKGFSLVPHQHHVVIMSTSYMLIIIRCMPRSPQNHFKAKITQSF